MLTSLTTQNWEDPVSGYWLMWLACLRLRLRLGLRSRLGFFGGRWLVFLLSRRLRFLRWGGFGFFLLLSRFRFRLLLGDSLVFRKHPVLQVRWNNIRGFSIRVDLDHAGSG